MPTYLGIEGGGTTWKVAIAQDKPDNITESIRFDTTSPEETFGKIKEWIKDKNYDSVGIATFGPVDPKLTSPTYGHITTTPKPGWKNVDVVGALTDGSKPILFDTDVNAPALAEFTFHASSPTQSSVAYITVGTGVGVGLVINGKTVHGLVHPEGGHVPPFRLPSDGIKGNDLYKDIEGLSNTIAIASKKGIDRHLLKTIGDDDAVWDSVAHALGSLCATLVLMVSVERIVISGGVLNRTILYPKIRAKTLEILKGYIVHPLLTPALIDQYITPSEWGDNAGIVGALTLAKVALDDKGKNSVLGKAQAYVCKHGAAVFLGVVLGAAATAVGVFGKRK